VLKTLISILNFLKIGVSSGINFVFWDEKFEKKKICQQPKIWPEGRGGEFHPILSGTMPLVTSYTVWQKRV